jgi:hypothetical protein
MADTNQSLVATIRNFASNTLSGAYSALRLTQFESLAVAQVEGQRVESVRSGHSFIGGCGVIASGIAPDATIPTTTAKLALYNSASSGGVTVFVHKIAATLGSGTAAAGSSLLIGVPALVQAAATTKLSDHNVTNLMPTSTATAKGILGTATMPAGTVWAAMGGVSTLAAANVGQSIGSLDFQGGLAIPPGYALGLGVFSAAGTSPLFSFSVTWEEYISTNY